MNKMRRNFFGFKHLFKVFAVENQVSYVCFQVIRKKEHLKEVQGENVVYISVWQQVSYVKYKTAFCLSLPGQSVGLSRTLSFVFSEGGQ